MTGLDSSNESDAEVTDVLRDDNSSKQKPGIIYLSSVPNGYNVGQTTAFFSEFGSVGRVFLQPSKNLSKKIEKDHSKPGKSHKSIKGRLFTEGWIEFKSKRVARSVAETLNRTLVGGKRRSKAYDELWNIKYLPRFKWIHLSERLAYEAAVKQQRLRTEISQVKREAEHFKSSVERKKKRAKKDKSLEEKSGGEEFVYHFKQKETESEIKKRKRDENVTPADREVTGTKSKKTKKSHVDKDKAKVKSVKSDKKEKVLAQKKEGDRNNLLKSVFGKSRN